MTDTVTRFAGLPEDRNQHFFGFDNGGNVWALQWSKDHGCWAGVSFQRGWPATRLFRGDAERDIVSTVSAPISAIATA